MMRLEMWQAATVKYRSPKPIVPPPQATTKPAQTEVKLLSEGELIARARVLESFMRSKTGQVALNLLKASKEFILFAAEYDGGGITVAWGLHGNGFVQLLEKTGTGQLYSKGSPTMPEFSMSDALEVLRHAFNPRTSRIDGLTQETMDEFQIIDWLKIKLDKIADRGLHPR